MFCKVSLICMNDGTSIIENGSLDSQMKLSKSMSSIDWAAHGTEMPPVTFTFFVGGSQ